MTAENVNLRDRLKAVETKAAQCLASQPQDDRECRSHLLRGLSRIAEDVGLFGGMVEVEAYDIEWAEGGPEESLPRSAKVICNICGLIADRLSKEFNQDVRHCKWRLV